MADRGISEAGRPRTSIASISTSLVRAMFALSPEDAAPLDSTNNGTASRVAVSTTARRWYEGRFVGTMIASTRQGGASATSTPTLARRFRCEP
ncbi:hypothetical protein A6A25_04775 [Saccharothrix sp. CB00851]|nr:hypothetical protein A6A25_04775 [Saccharothrix sp. CB00851]